MWYHYTNKASYENILKNGFKLPENYGRFGIGVYFTNNKNGSSFGDYKIGVEINKDILKLTHKDICRKIFPQYNLEAEEEGIPLLKEYVLNKGYKAVAVYYEDGDMELIVYDLNVVKIACISL